MATKSNNTTGTTNMADFGIILNDLNANSDNVYKGNWGQILLTSLRYDLNNYLSKIYFYGITDINIRNYALTSLFTINPNQTYRPDCWYNNVKYTNCGTGNNIHLGWVHDPAGPWEWFSQVYSVTVGSGNFNNTASTKARIWVK